MLLFSKLIGLEIEFLLVFPILNESVNYPPKIVLLVLILLDVSPNESALETSLKWTLFLLS